MCTTGSIHSGVPYGGVFHSREWVGLQIELAKSYGIIAWFTHVNPPWRFQAHYIMSPFWRLRTLRTYRCPVPTGWLLSRGIPPIQQPAPLFLPKRTLQILTIETIGC